MSSKTQKTVLVLAGLVVTIMVGLVFSSQPAHDAIRTVASAVWGS